VESLKTDPRRSPTEICWEEMDAYDHSVQIYADTQSFLDALEGFASGGLRAGESVIIVATAAHRKALERMLDRRGHDLNQARLENRYLAVDAEMALSEFMVEDWPDETKFRHLVTGLLTRARENGRQARVFGEMVSLLWSQGNQAATVHLESLWNTFCVEESFYLLCAYPRSGFSKESRESLRTICAHHTRVIPE